MMTGGTPLKWKAPYNHLYFSKLTIIDHFAWQAQKSQMLFGVDPASQAASKKNETRLFRTDAPLLPSLAWGAFWDNLYKNLSHRKK